MRENLPVHERAFRIEITVGVFSSVKACKSDLRHKLYILQKNDELSKQAIAVLVNGGLQDSGFRIGSLPNFCFKNIL